MADITQYTDLITSEHNQAPKFKALVALLCQGSVDNQNLLATLSRLYDIDQAVGTQLDVLGQWIGASRIITTPLTGVFFSWATDGLGWGQGTWQGDFDAEGPVIILPDDSYRILLKATIASNQWDGTVPGAYAIWSIVFALEGFRFLIIDNQDMTMSIVLMTNPVSAVVLALLVSGHIALKPAGVGIKGYFTSSLPGAPIFAWGVETMDLQGWGQGSWIKSLT